MSRRSSSCPFIYPSSTDACSCANAQCAMHSSALRARCSAHAGLLLCYMSPEVEAALPEQAQALYAWLQELYQHPATIDDVCRYPSLDRQSVAMHTTKRRFGGSKQRMIISKLNSTTRNWPSACCPPRNNDAAGAPRPRRQPPQPCLLSRRRREREPLRGPHARMTRRTTTRLFSRHPVPEREGAKQGRRFDVPKQHLYILCIFCIFVIFCTSDILCIFCI